MRWVYRYWPIIPLLFLVVVAQEFFEESPDGIEIEATIDMRETQSDYYLEDFTSRSFDIAGNLQYRVSGNRLLHYPDDNRSEIEAPNVVFLRDDIRWDITSKLGEMRRKPDTFTLHGKVLLERASNSSATLTIRTESLSIHTDRNEVSTDEAIEVSAEGWHMSSVGLQSSLDKGKLIFLSQVKGHYDVACAW